MGLSFIVHETSDSVGVAVMDLQARTGASGRFQHPDGEVEIAVIDPVPLGHKLAMADIPQGGPVVDVTSDAS